VLLLDAIVEEADMWKLVSLLWGFSPFYASDLCLGSCKSGCLYLVLLLSIKKRAFLRVP
jgi:hypothetical protein